MIKVITIAAVLLIITFSTSQSQTNTDLEIFTVEKPVISKDYIINHKDYTLHFELDKTKDQQHILKIAIELHNKSYFVSPNAKREFKGKFRRDLGSTKDLDYDGNLIETPLSIEEYDAHPFVNGTVNWVRENTSYIQPLELKTKDDFQVYGRIIFTIEPRCTLEEIPFLIIYKDGDLLFGEPKC
jgi:hypothetical protein